MKIASFLALSIMFNHASLNVEATCISAIIETKVSFSSCNEILESNPDASSGLYKLKNSAGTFEVYCEMKINGGGYTFLKSSSLSLGQKLIDSVFHDKSQILYKLMSRKNPQSQPYTVIKQLDDYASVPIGIMINNSTGYQGKYIYIYINIWRFKEFCYIRAPNQNRA